MPERSPAVLCGVNCMGDDRSCGRGISRVPSPSSSLSSSSSLFFFTFRAFIFLPFLGGVLGGLRASVDLSSLCDGNYFRSTPSFRIHQQSKVAQITRTA